MNEYCFSGKDDAPFSQIFKTYTFKNNIGRSKFSS